MKQYVERMIREKEDLEGKIKKAEKALENRPFDMTDIGADLLKEQVKAMEQYLFVLCQRIKYEAGGMA